MNIGLRSIIVSEFPDSRILEADTIQNSLLLSNNFRIGTVILDAGVSDGKDASLLDSFRESNPDTAIIVHLGDDFEYIYAFIRTGIHSLISKKSDPVEIIEAIRVAQSKAKFIGFDIQQILLSHIAADPLNRQLTRKERLIADLLAANASYKQIAEAAKVKRDSVAEYKHRIFEKLRVDNIDALALKLTEQFVMSKPMNG
ncbi:LuxR C-terminal-related transcriptional regulator [Dyadobacter sp. 676]|uniref:LuxR C-terminal-related transcriptional regulator n=1 Tax=Dyadobacter sp. 676 TaxID=3088362 RepID=A0AAU8FGE4_9BACT